MLLSWALLDGGNHCNNSSLSCDHGLGLRKMGYSWKNTIIIRDVYGVRTAPRSSFSFLKISRSGYPPVRKVTDDYGADIRLHKFHGLVRSGYPALNMSRSGADFFECVTERSGADIRLRGKSRIFTQRISAATNVTDYCGADIRRTVFFTERFISLRRANRTKPRHFPTVHRSNYPVK